MIRVDINENFTIAVTLIDETTGEAASGKNVSYDIRNQPDDSQLSPPVEGTLTESLVEPGIYTTVEVMDTAGNYLIYATCSGFISNTEELTVNEENIYDLAKQNRHYNTAVEDVIRENSTATASQTARNVAVGNTDYVLTHIKGNDESDWSGTVASGIVYAWYKNVDDSVPYKMGGPGV